MKKIVALLIALSMLFASCGFAEQAAESALVSSTSVKAVLKILEEVFEGSVSLTYDEDGCERADIHFSGADEIIDIFAQIGSDGVVVGSGDNAVEVPYSAVLEALTMTVTEAFPEVVALFNYLSGTEFQSDLGVLSSLLVTEINRLANCMAQAGLITVSEEGDFVFSATLQQLVELAAAYLSEVSKDETVFTKLSTLYFWNAMGIPAEEVASLTENLPAFVANLSDTLAQTQIPVSGRIYAEVLASGEVHVQAELDTVVFTLDYNASGLTVYLANETPDGFTVKAALNADGFTLSAAGNAKGASYLNLTLNNDGLNVSFRLMADDTLLTGNAVIGENSQNAVITWTDEYGTPVTLQILACADELLVSYSELADSDEDANAVNLHITKSNIDFTAVLTDDSYDAVNAEFHKDKVSGVYSGLFKYIFWDESIIDLTLNGTDEGFRVTGNVGQLDVACEAAGNETGVAATLTISQDGVLSLFANETYDMTTNSGVAHVDCKIPSLLATATADFTYDGMNSDGIVLVNVGTENENGEVVYEQHELRITGEKIETDDVLGYHEQILLDGESVAVMEYGIRLLSDEPVDVELYFMEEAQGLGSMEIRLPVSVKNNDNGYTAKVSLIYGENGQSAELGSLEIELIDALVKAVPHVYGRLVSAEELSETMMEFLELITY